MESKIKLHNYLLSSFPFTFLLNKLLIRETSLIIFFPLFLSLPFLLPFLPLPSLPFFSSPLLQMQHVFSLLPISPLNPFNATIVTLDTISICQSRLQVLLKTKSLKRLTLQVLGMAQILMPTKYSLTF